MTRKSSAWRAAVRMLAVLALLTAVLKEGSAMEPSELPGKAPRDAIMASGEEIEAVHQWARAAFAGAEPGDTEGVEVRLVRQDFNTLHFGESCMGTPQKIGSRWFERGLGTHANSEITATFPVGAAAFKASVGIDNNYDTRGTRGSVEFAVRLDDREVFRTPTCKGGDEPVAVEVPLPPGTTRMTLFVETTPDGAAYDQSDWADARIVMADGRTLWLDARRPHPFLHEPRIPFSFVYDGSPSARFLASWRHEAGMHESEGRTRIEASWSDPETGLVLHATATTFRDYPALDWVLSFENRGEQDTPILEDILTADMMLGSGNERQPFVLHQLRGDSAGESSFTPYETVLRPGEDTTIAPTGGRPSQVTAFPFWNVEDGDGGAITAIGWSGQWSAGYTRERSGLSRFRAGMEHTHLVLHPGEHIRLPRVLLMPWRGDRQAAHNRFRRLLLFEYIPRIDGKPIPLPVVLQAFDRYNWTLPEWATEAGQIKAAEAAHAAGCDAYWFDAAWFPGNFPRGVGNWFCKPDAFPRGLAPIGKRCDELGLRFIVWFEPGRVAPNTQIANEHPEYTLESKDGPLAWNSNLYNLGDPEARRFITELISRRIGEFGVDIYREDFNIDPLSFWETADAPDRQGMAEIRWVEGHYQFWDDLRARHPGLWIDNCSSGGRRIDLETCMRSAPLWRSDASCGPGHSEWQQQQSLALSQYLPLHTASSWTLDRYAVRSSATGGLAVELDYLNPDFPMEQAGAALAEVKQSQKYWYGDFYPLTPANSALDQFSAWQFHRADLDEGIVLAFRRPECALMGLFVAPHGLHPARTYRFEFIDEQGDTETRTLTGAAVSAEGLPLRIPGRRQSLLVRYQARP